MVERQPSKLEATGSSPVTRFAMKIDLTFPSPEEGVWRVETEDGTFDYPPDRYGGARRRFESSTSDWARISKLVDRTAVGPLFRVVRARGSVPARGNLEV